MAFWSTDSGEGIAGCQRRPGCCGPGTWDRQGLGGVGVRRARRRGSAGVTAWGTADRGRHHSAKGSPPRQGPPAVTE